MEPNELAEHLKTLKVSVEDIINAARILATEDLEQYKKGSPSGEPPNDLVIACIEGCVQHLQDASFAMYASYK